MDLAGVVKVRVQADISELNKGLATAKAKTDAFDRDATKGFTNVGRAAKGMGADVQGAAASIAGANDNISGSAARAAQAFGAMRLAVGGFVAAFGAAILGVTAFSDRAKSLEAQMRLVSGSAEGAAGAMAKVRDVALETRSRMEPTVSLYTKLSRSVSEFGVSQERVLGVTRTIAQAYKVSGASAEEAANSMRQLAQGLSAGALRGDEFISVMEGAPRLAKAIADGMGVSVGALRDLAAEGKLTTDVIVKALEGQAGRIAAEFALMPATIGEAFGRIGDAVIRFVGEFDKVSGISNVIIAALNGVAVAIDFLTDHLDTLMKLVNIVGAAMLVAFGPAIISGVGALASAIAVGLVGAVRVLTVAIAANPLGFLLVAITSIITAAWVFRDDMKRIFGVDLGAIVKDSANWLVGTMVGAYNGLVATWDQLPAAMSDIAKRAGWLFLDTIRYYINEALLLIGDVTTYLDTTLGTNLGRPDMLGPIAPPESTGAASSVGKTFNDEIRKARGTDWFGGDAAAMPAGSTPETAKGVAQLGEAAKEAAKQLERIKKLGEDLAFETSQLFRSEQDQGIAQRLRGAGVPVDLNSPEAQTMRWNEQFKETKASITGFFSDFRSALQENGGNIGKALAQTIANSFSKAADKIFNQLFDQLATAITSAFMGPAPGGGGGGIISSLGASVAGGLSGGSGSSGSVASAGGAVDLAKNLLGFSEGRNASQINSFLKAGGVDLNAASEAWCAGFVNSSLEQIGIKGSGSNLANSFLNWGKNVSPSQVLKGDVLVNSRGLGADMAGGHVGLATGSTRMGASGLELQMMSGNTGGAGLGTGGVGTDWINATKLDVRRATEGLGDLGGTAVETAKSLTGGLGSLSQALMNVGGGAGGGGWFSGLMGIFGGAGGATSFMNSISPLATSFIAGGGVGLFAKGGITNEPAIFGEAGPEAAVPLPDGRRIPVDLKGVNQNQGRQSVSLHVHVNGATGNEEVRRMVNEGSRAALAEHQIAQQRGGFGQTQQRYTAMKG